VDGLVAWLDERGHREKALRKELQLWRDVVVECMGKMHAYLDDDEKKKGEEEASPPPQPATRVSTRTKTYVDVDAANKWRCLAWSNTTAIDELGLRHGDGLKRGVAETTGKGKMDKKAKAGKKGGK
jgi:hypothetical protein